MIFEERWFIDSVFENYVVCIVCVFFRFWFCKCFFGYFFSYFFSFLLKFFCLVKNVCNCFIIVFLISLVLLIGFFKSGLRIRDIVEVDVFLGICMIVGIKGVDFVVFREVSIDFWGLFEVFRVFGGDWVAELFLWCFERLRVCTSFDLVFLIRGGLYELGWSFGEMIISLVLLN